MKARPHASKGPTVRSVVNDASWPPVQKEFTIVLGIAGDHSVSRWSARSEGDCDGHAIGVGSEVLVQAG
jgi:hypothetical protein